VTRPSAPENPRSRPGYSPAIASRNAAAARAAAQPPIAPAPSSVRLMNYAEATRAAAARATAPPPALAAPGGIPGYDKMSFEQKRLAQDQAAARRGGR
jgi:hypothetical protein